MEEFDLLPTFERMLEDVAPLEVVRTVEAGGTIAVLWAALEESGFLDLLVPENAGGAGVSLADAAPLIEALGAWLVPAPVAQTMAARALLANAGLSTPSGPILLATATAARQTAYLPFTEVAEHRLLEEAGFLNLLVPEHAGGGSIPLSDAASVAQTMAARALLASAGYIAPPGPILPAATWQTAYLPFAEVAEHVLLELNGQVILTRLTPDELRPAGVYASRTACVGWADQPEALATLELRPGALRALGAVLRATEISGMAGKALELTVAYANERAQFGKPIGKQQAVQQQMAVMAEQAVLARIAARLGCAAGLTPSLAAAAAAKQVTSAAVPVLTSVAHAVHGAIGISEEYRLQLYTCRLHEWRMADGTETYWATQLGDLRLTSDAATSIDFVRAASPV